MTSIFLDNIPIQKSYFQAVAIDDNSNHFRGVIGFETQALDELMRKSVLPNLFSAILLHEKIYVKVDDILRLMTLINPLDVLLLMERKILCGVVKQFSSFGRILADGSVEVDFAYFERRQEESFEEKIRLFDQLDNFSRSSIVQYLDNSKKIVDFNECETLCKKDLILDLNNENHKISCKDKSLFLFDSVFDAEKFLRVSRIVEGLVIQSSLGFDCIIQDAYAKEYLSLKLGSMYSEDRMDSPSFFKKASDLKRIPDLYHLYTRKTISMHDVLDIRDHFNASIFRKWAHSLEYNQSELVFEMTKAIPTSKGWAKFIRWLYPNIVGIASPWMGAASAAFDSYIIEKIVSGWNPSLFLDDVLSNRIDRRIASAEKELKREQVYRRFPDINRNSKCPCQSGKKFKVCCGFYK